MARLSLPRCRRQAFSSDRIRECAPAVCASDLRRGVGRGWWSGRSVSGPGAAGSDRWPKRQADPTQTRPARNPFSRPLPPAAPLRWTGAQGGRSRSHDEGRERTGRKEGSRPTTFHRPDSMGSSHSSASPPFTCCWLMIPLHCRSPCRALLSQQPHPPQPNIRRSRGPSPPAHAATAVTAPLTRRRRAPPAADTHSRISLSAACCTSESHAANRGSISPHPSVRPLSSVTRRPLISPFSQPQPAR